VKAGMEPIDVLKTATINAAKAFRLRDKGVIKENNSADFVLVNGNLLNDINQLNKIEAVWKKGVKIR